MHIHFHMYNPTPSRFELFPSFLHLWIIFLSILFRTPVIYFILYVIHILQMWCRIIHKMVIQVSLAIVVMKYHSIGCSHAQSLRYRPFAKALISESHRASCPEKLPKIAAKLGLRSWTKTRYITELQHNCWDRKRRNSIDATSLFGDARNAPLAGKLKTP